jgi:hypothetical protein
LFDSQNQDKKEGYRAIMHMKKKHYFGHAAKQCCFGALAFVFL